MQVGIDVTSMHTNFGGQCLFGFGDTALVVLVLSSLVVELKVKPSGLIQSILTTTSLNSLVRVTIQNISKVDD